MPAATPVILTVMEPLPPLIFELCRAVLDEGGRAFLVGGWVRDLEMRRLQGLAGFPVAEERDLEGYRVPAERLASRRGRFGEGKVVGQAVAVYQLVPRHAAG